MKTPASRANDEKTKNTADMKNILCAKKNIPIATNAIIRLNPYDSLFLNFVAAS